MTLERKIIIGLEDIEAVILECLNRGCGYKISASPDRPLRIPDTCPQCDHRWVKTDISGYMDRKVSPFLNFTKSIETIRAAVREAGTMNGFRILLEFNEPSA